MNIDRIARAMVDVEPSADLEARIRARVREARPARSAAWWSWRVAAPIAAAATMAIIIGVQVSRGLPTEAQSAKVGPGVVTSVGVQGSRSPEVVNTSQPPNVPTSTQLARPRPGRTSAAVAKLSAEEVAWMDRRMPALDPVTALQMDRLHMDSIQPEPLAITPLTMTPVGTDGTGKGAL